MTDDQEAQNVAAGVLHLLTQRSVDARNWERQAHDWKALAERRRDELSGLLAIVGTSTPIAAFDLATTWRAEKVGLMDELAAMERTARRQLAEYELIVREWEARCADASSELNTLRAQLEDTQRSLDDMEKRYERVDRQNDELAAEHELLRHQASEARIDAQAANNAMYHAIRREQEAQTERRALCDLYTRQGGEMATLTQLARAVCESAAQQNGALVALVSTAALRQLGKAVSDGT